MEQFQDKQEWSQQAAFGQTMQGTRKTVAYDEPTRETPVLKTGNVEIRSLGRRFTSDRVSDAMTKHYFNETVSRDTRTQRLFDQALDIVLNSLRTNNDVFWSLGEAAQDRESRAPSDRSWNERDSKSFWFILCDPAESPVKRHFSDPVVYAFKGAHTPDMSGNLGYCMTSAAKSLIELATERETAKLRSEGASAWDIEAARDRADSEIHTINQAIRVALGVYDEAVRSKRRLQTHMNQFDNSGLS